MTTSTTDQTRTITLSDRPPVRIREADWPIIARASGDSWSGHFDYGRYQQAKTQGELDDWWLIVRQHEDGRAIVYGKYSTGWHPQAEDWRGGEVLEAGANLAAAIRRVGEAGNIPDLCIRECIADLPAEDM